MKHVIIIGTGLAGLSWAFNPMLSLPSMPAVTLQFELNQPATAFCRFYVSEQLYSAS